MQRTPLMCPAMVNQMINDHDAVAGNHEHEHNVAGRADGVRPEHDG